MERLRREASEGSPPQAKKPAAQTASEPHETARVEVDSAPAATAKQKQSKESVPRTHTAAAPRPQLESGITFITIICFSF